MIERTAFIIGIILVLLPYLGIFNSWKEGIVFVAGFVLILHSGFVMFNKPEDRVGRNDDTDK